MGALGLVQIVAVMANLRWLRWLVAVPLSLFWCLVTSTIGQSSLFGAETVPLSLALYAPTAGCSLAVVIRLPREFPPRVG